MSPNLVHNASISNNSIKFGSGPKSTPIKITIMALMSDKPRNLSQIYFPQREGEGEIPVATSVVLY